jgi:TatD DNase family protein
MNSEYRKRMVFELPLETLVLETDAPYLSPVQGKRNESINIKLTAAEIAKIKGVDFENVSKVTTANVERFFGVKF